MKKEMFLQIPMPCHEDWNKMTAVQQGRYCASCEKSVVDFTNMSDAEIFRIMNKNKSELCGRFDETQLLRPIAQPVQPLKKKYWAILMTMLLSFGSAFSQVQKKTKPQREKVELQAGENLIGEVIVTGGIVARNDLRRYSIVDIDGKPVAGAVVYINKSLKPMIADSAGRFVANRSSNRLNISCMGFESLEINANEIVDDRIVMKRKDNYLEAVTVKCSARQLMGFMIGRSVVQKKSKYKLEPASLLNSTSKTSISFSVFPNPAMAGSTLFLQTVPGKYQAQLINEEGKIITVQTLNIENKEVEGGIKLPSNMASGIYSLRLINLKSRQNTVTRVFISNY